MKKWMVTAALAAALTLPMFGCSKEAPAPAPQKPGSEAGPQMPQQPEKKAPATKEKPQAPAKAPMGPSPDSGEAMPK